MSEAIISKLRRLAALAPDGKRVFGFATILQDVADDLEAVQQAQATIPPLQALVQQWRDAARAVEAIPKQDTEIAAMDHGASAVYGECADELEAALLRAAGSPRQYTGIRDVLGELRAAGCADDRAAALRAAIPAPREPQIQEHEEDPSRVDSL